MEFSLMHAGLAAGAALAALPVILHLFMKPTPKQVVFPALRLIRERQLRSKKKMRIKNWLLLAARMLLLALMALALARPRLHSETPLGDDSVPTALGLVFDTSLSMGYRQNDRTLLDQAKARALELLDRIPDSSLVFAADSASPASKTGRSPAAARKWIGELTVRAVNRPLNVAMGEVYEAVLECDRPRREVYVLSDLAKTAWDLGRPAEGLDKVTEAAEKPGGKVATVVLRLGPPAAEREDVSIDEIEIPSGEASTGEPVEIRGLVRAHGAKPASRIVEFYLDGAKKGQKPVEIPAGGQVEVSFLTPPRLKEDEVHRAELRVTGAPDPLAFDDSRFLSFRARPPLKVLIVSDLNIDADWVALALAPEQGAGGYQVDVARPSELPVKYADSLKERATVFLLDVQGLDAASWGLLNAYVHEGGGLVVGLGPRCRPDDYNGPIASQILPAQLEVPVTPPENAATFGKVVDPTHPLFDRYVEAFESQFAAMPVYKYWKLKTPTTGRTILTFADGSPALLERDFQGARTGRVLMWTTPLARRPLRSDPAAWNELPNLSYWVFPVVMNLTVPYLAGTTADDLVFVAGEDALLPLGPNAAPTDVRIIGPDGKTTEAVTPPPPGEPLRIASPQYTGHWTVTTTGPGDARAALGFSLNAPADESRFVALEPADLDSLFGKEGYTLAGDDKALRKVTDLIRVGRELFPWLMFLILILVTAENYLANTFYKEPAAGATAPGAAPAAASA